MEKMILKHGICDNRYYRITFEVEEYIFEDTPSIKRIATVKVQVKIFILGFSKYVTIKEWSRDYYNTKEKEFIKSEAEELFDKIVNPYKV